MTVQYHDPPMTPLYVISDIFGRTPVLEEFCHDLTGPDFLIIDPYKGKHMEFDTESRAYAFFMEHTGPDQYRSIIKDRLQPAGEGIRVIGFSVGASAVWQISGEKGFSHVKKAICFYPSRIRDFPDIRPGFDVTLVFPASEPQFDVDEMILKQTGKPRVSCCKADGGHGFMNRLSKNFHPDLYRTFIRDMGRRLSSNC